MKATSHRAQEKSYRVNVSGTNERLDGVVHIWIFAFRSDMQQGASGTKKIMAVSARIVNGWRRIRHMNCSMTV